MPICSVLVLEAGSCIALVDGSGWPEGPINGISSRPNRSAQRLLTARQRQQKLFASSPAEAVFQTNARTNTFVELFGLGGNASDFPSGQENLVQRGNR